MKPSEPYQFILSLMERYPFPVSQKGWKKTKCQTSSTAMDPPVMEGWHPLPKLNFLCWFSVCVKHCFIHSVIAILGCQLDCIWNDYNQETEGTLFFGSWRKKTTGVKAGRHTINLLGAHIRKWNKKRFLLLGLLALTLIVHSFTGPGAYFFGIPAYTEDLTSWA